VLTREPTGFHSLRRDAFRVGLRWRIIQHLEGSQRSEEHICSGCRPGKDIVANIGSVEVKAVERNPSRFDEVGEIRFTSRMHLIDRDLAIARLPQCLNRLLGAVAETLSEDRDQASGTRQNIGRRPVRLNYGPERGHRTK
jgi:hypothetical protein